MPTRNKLEQERHEELIDCVYCDIINGMSTYHLARKLQTPGAYCDSEGKPYRVYKRAQAYTIVLEAFKNIRTKPKDLEDEENKRSLYRERLLNIYQEGMDNADRATALAALKELAKAEMIDTPQKVELSGKVEEEITIDFKCD